MRRRDFLITTSTGAMLSVASLAAAAAATDAAAIVAPVFGGTAASGVSVVLYEPRYSASREFARLLVDRGALAFSTRDDVVSLWRGALGDCLNCEAPRIAGLTLHSDFEILRACARDRGMKVLRETLHRYDTSQSVGETTRSVALASWLIVG